MRPECAGSGGDTSSRRSGHSSVRPAAPMGWRRGGCRRLGAHKPLLDDADTSADPDLPRVEGRGLHEPEGRQARADAFRALGHQAADLMALAHGIVSDSQGATRSRRHPARGTGILRAPDDQAVAGMASQSCEQVHGAVVVHVAVAKARPIVVPSADRHGSAGPGRRRSQPSCSETKGDLAIRPPGIAPACHLTGLASARI
jgi:hypothetical protein